MRLTPTRNQTNAIQIIQGGQYGSEAKGAVAGYLAIHDRMDAAVRTGATNAGHTVYHQGQKFVMQQLPVGWVNPNTFLVIGAGALIDPTILRREIADIAARTGEDIRGRLLVDPRAYVHWPANQEASAKSGRHELIGATGKGCSQALISRLQLRGVEDFSFGVHAKKLNLGVRVGDTELYLNRLWDQGGRIQIEGTQGQLLDLALGPYPYTTHKQCGPAQWLSECGLSPNLPLDIVMVVRTFPIRVAGNSGPLPNEISWPRMARLVNGRRADADLLPIVNLSAIIEFENAVMVAAEQFEIPLASTGLDQHWWEDRVKYRDALSNLNARALSLLEPDTVEELRKLFEMTTVTKKLRRIAQLDMATLEVSARQIRPSRVAVTFLNYQFPERWATNNPVTSEEMGYLDGIAATCQAPIELVNRGPLPEHFVRC